MYDAHGNPIEGGKTTAVEFLETTHDLPEAPILPDEQIPVFGTAYRERAAPAERDRRDREEVWERMGWPAPAVRQIALESPVMIEFRTMLFSKVVANVKRLGLLTPWLGERFTELDILKFEHEEPSA